MNKACLAMLMTLPVLTGCLIQERQEVRVQFTPGGAEVWVKESGWKSSEEETEKIKEDFDELIQKYTTSDLEHVLSEHAGVYVLDKKIFLKGDKIHTEYHGLAAQGSLAMSGNFTKRNDEIVHVLNAPENAKVESNGKIFRTDKNIVLTWPEVSKTLTWSYVDEAAVKKADNLLKLYKAWEKK